MFFLFLFLVLRAGTDLRCIGPASTSSTLPSSPSFTFPCPIPVLPTHSTSSLPAPDLRSALEAKSRRNFEEKHEKCNGFEIPESAHGCGSLRIARSVPDIAMPVLDRTLLCQYWARLSQYRTSCTHATCLTNHRSNSAFRYIHKNECPI